MLSHNHFDHMDIRTLRHLSVKHRPMVLAGLGNKIYLKKERIPNARELDWWRQVKLGPEVRVTFVPAQHFSSRSMSDRNTTLWGGYVIESAAHKVYFAGDTGFGPHFAQIHKKFGPVSLALLPIGAFKPRWFMAPVHLSPGEAVRAHRILNAQRSMAIHYGTFPLGDDAQDEPVRELRKAMKQANVSTDRFWILDFGEGRNVPASASVPSSTSRPNASPPNASPPNTSPPNTSRNTPPRPMASQASPPGPKTVAGPDENR